MNEFPEKEIKRKDFFAKGIKISHNISIIPPPSGNYNKPPMDFATTSDFLISSLQPNIVEFRFVHRFILHNPKFFRSATFGFKDFPIIRILEFRAKIPFFSTQI